MDPMTRREFFRTGTKRTGKIAAVGAVALAGQHRLAGAVRDKPNPFAYRIRHLAKTDPELVHYSEVSRLKSPVENPRRIATGPEGRLYLAAGTKVSVLGTAGDRRGELELEDKVRCIRVCPDGVTYVGMRDHVVVFDAKGKRVATWESLEGRPWLTGLAVGENDVFAADAGNRVIHRYDRSGTHLRRIGKRDRERNVPGFVIPSPYLDVELHRDGLLRVNNPGRHRVEIYTPDGDFELAWGKPSAAIDGFCGCCNPIGIALTSDDRYVTCEKGLPRVKVYAEHGEFECVVAGPEAFPENVRIGAGNPVGDDAKAGLDIALDETNRVYILDQVAGNVHVMEHRKARG